MRKRAHQWSRDRTINGKPGDLIPKRIRDRNGRITTVYVKPDAREDAMSARVAIVSNSSALEPILQAIHDGEYKPVIDIGHQEIMTPDSAERYLAGESDQDIESYLAQRFEHETVLDVIAHIEEDNGKSLSCEQEEQVLALLQDSKSESIAAARDEIAKQTVLPMRTRVQNVSVATNGQIRSPEQYEVAWRGHVYHGRPTADKLVIEGPVELARIDKNGNLLESVQVNGLTANSRLTDGTPATSLDDSSNPDHGMSWKEATGRSDYPRPVVRSQ